LHIFGSFINYLHTSNLSFVLLSSDRKIYGSVSAYLRTSFLLFFNWYSGGWGGGVQLDLLGTATTNRLIVPAPSDYDDGEIGGM
jgi:hypothetical protein